MLSCIQEYSKRLSSTLAKQRNCKMPVLHHQLLKVFLLIWFYLVFQRKVGKTLQDSWCNDSIVSRYWRLLCFLDCVLCSAPWSLLCLVCQMCLLCAAELTVCTVNSPRGPNLRGSLSAQNFICEGNWPPCWWRLFVRWCFWEWICIGLEGIELTDVMENAFPLSW